MKIAVLGAGVSGLTSAWHLARAGHDVRVFEARDRLGGNIWTEEVDGCLVEWGPNGFLDNEPATLGLVDALGIGDRIVRAREEAARRWIFRAGALREIPTSPPRFLLGDCLPLRARLAVLLEPFTLRSNDPDESVRDFAVRHLGRGAADLLVDAMVTGVFAGDPARLSVRSAFPKLWALERDHRSLVLGAKGRGVGPRGTLTSFDGGLDVLVRALAEGLDVRRGEALGSLPSGFDRVVCTLPAPRAAELLDDDGLAHELRKIPHSPVVVAALVFDAPEPGVAAGFGFLRPHREALRILGCLYDSHVFPGRTPEGRQLFRVLLGGRRDPGVVDLDDARILEIVARDLERAWGRFPTPRTTKVVRHPLGIAQYEIGHARRLERIAALCPPELRLAGASYRGVSLNLCIRDALGWDPAAPA